MICDLPPEIPAISLGAADQITFRYLRASGWMDGAKQILGAVFKKQKFINAASSGKKLTSLCAWKIAADLCSGPGVLTRLESSAHCPFIDEERWDFFLDASRSGRVWNIIRRDRKLQLSSWTPCSRSTWTHNTHAAATHTFTQSSSCVL